MEAVVDTGESRAAYRVRTCTASFRTADITVVGDVRLDNAVELAAQLGGAAESALALVARAYARWGRDLALHLVGDYAIVVVDAGGRMVVAARDAFGVRRLAYRRLATGLAFASDVGALAMLGTPRAELDPSAVHGFLVGAPRSHQQTYFRTIARVPAGHTLVAGPSGMALRRHFFPPPGERRLPRQATLEAFRAQLEESVRDRVRAERSVIVEVSGGLDSSSIACVADSLGGPSELHYLHGRYREADEQRFVAAVDARLRTRISVFDEEASATLDEPIDPGGPDAYPLVAAVAGVDALAARTGARAVLSGIGGDELLFERGVFRDLAAHGQWVKLWRETGLAHRYSTSSRRFFLRDALRSLVPRARAPRSLARVMGAVRRLRRARTPDWLRPPPPPTPPTLPEIELLAWDWHSETQRFTWDWLTRPALAATLEAEDRAAAIAGRQMRYPFLDTRLAHLVLATPYAHRVPGGRMKVLLRDALAEVLPPAIRERSQVTAFDGAIVAAITKKLPALRDVLERGPWCSDPWVDRSRAFALLRRVSVATPDVRSATALWDVVTLERWLRALA